MSCTSPLTVASTTVPFCWPSTRSMCGSRHATAAFMVSADCSTKGSCILPEPKSSPTTFMPSSRKTLMISRGLWVSMASLRSSSMPEAVAVDDALLQALLDRGGTLLLRGFGALAIAEEGDIGVERIVAGLAPVVDQVLGDARLGLGDLVERQDARDMDDRRGEAALQRVVEEHRVQHVARRRVEAEGNIGEAQCDLALRQLRRDALDGVEGMEAELAVVLVAGADGEGQGIDDEIGLRQTVAPAGEVAQAAWRPRACARPPSPCPARRW